MGKNLVSFVASGAHAFCEKSCGGIPVQAGNLTRSQLFFALFWLISFVSRANQRHPCLALSTSLNYQDEESIIELNGMSVVEVAADYVKRRHVFRVRPTSEGELLFQTESSDEARSWVESIQMVIDRVWAILTLNSFCEICLAQGIKRRLPVHFAANPSRISTPWAEFIATFLK